MKRYIFLGIVVISLGLFYTLTKKELDDRAVNGPFISEIIQKTNETKQLTDILAAGISWDYDNDRFFVSTDQPHELFSNGIASFYIFNKSFEKVLYSMDLKTDGDLEGITYIGNNELAIISEVGTLYFLKEKDQQWELTKTISLPKGDIQYKLASLAYDSKNKYLYTAQKEGKKIIYKMNRDGKLLDSFTLKVQNVTENKKTSINDDYTISGMTFKKGHLYVFSEAYSTIFKYNPNTKHVDNIYGISNIHESSGITIKKGSMYLVGDFESYLPKPSFYEVALPQ